MKKKRTTKANFRSEKELRTLESDMSELQSQLGHLLTVDLRNSASLSLVCGVCVCTRTCICKVGKCVLYHCSVRIQRHSRYSK